MLSNRKLLSMLLTKRGFSVTMAEDGEICVKQVEQAGVHFYDLIFLDNTMPNMVSTYIYKHSFISISFHLYVYNYFSLFGCII